MARKSAPKKAKITLAVNNPPQQKHAPQQVIAIVPMEEGVFAWIVEEPNQSRLF